MSNRPSIAYQPALDGVRALAVAAVVLFHAGVPGFDGGYLGVSVFFTLSGYLITTLLLTEHEQTGRIDLRAFYARRIRRLMPASLLCIGAIAVLAATTTLFDGVVGLRAQVWGALFQVSNWVLLAGDGSYQDLLARSSGTSSPLEHFWSLAIEEQFYWVWPPIALLLLQSVAGRRGRVLAIGGATLVFAASAPVIAAVWGPDAAYWATPARLAEILIGALLAVVIAGRAIVSRWAPLAGVSLLAVLVCVLTFPSSGGPAYNGALPLFSVISVALVLGLQAPSRVRTMLSLAPLVWLGKVSYGVYLFHWPVFVLVHPDRFDWSAPTIFAVRIAVTMTVTVVSYVLIEQPIRCRPRSRRRTTFGGAAAATAAVAVFAAVMVAPDLDDYWVPEAEVAEAAAITPVEDDVAALVAPDGPAPTTPTPPTDDVESVEPDTTVPPSPSVVPELDGTATTPAPTTTVAPAPQRPVRIVMVGDSTARAFGTGVQTWAAMNPELAGVEVVAAPGCGFLRGGERRIGDTIGPDGCDGWVDEQVLPVVASLQPDIVVAMVTSWDIIDRRWDGGQMIGPLEDEFAQRLDADYRTLVSDLVASGAPHVAFVRHPRVDPLWLQRIDAQEDPERHQVVYDLFDELGAELDDVSVIDLDGFLTDTEWITREDVRPDGIHPTPEAAAAVSDAFLGPTIVRIALEAAST